MVEGVFRTNKILFDASMALYVRSHGTLQDIPFSLKDTQWTSKTTIWFEFPCSNSMKITPNSSHVGWIYHIFTSRNVVQSGHCRIVLDVIYDTMKHHFISAERVSSSQLRKVPTQKELPPSFLQQLWSYNILQQKLRSFDVYGYHHHGWYFSYI